MDIRDNNFDFLRLFAAIAVVYGHSFSLLSMRHDPFSGENGYGTLAEISVNIFFFISGFLITSSFIYSRDAKQFMMKRVRRIFPGLLVMLFLVCLVTLPFFAIISPDAYLRDKQTWAYIITNALLYPMIFEIKTLFTENPLPYAVNGSLWTLRAEFTLYIMIAFLGMTRLLHPRILLIGTIGMLCFLFFLIVPTGFVETEFLFKKLKHNEVAVLHARNTFFFLVGSFFFLKHKQIPVNHTVAAISLLILIFSIETPLKDIIYILLMPYIIYVVAYTEKLPLRDAAKYGDFSYGIYIYAFPIQQLLIHIYPYISPLLLFAIALPLSLACAVGSWHWVEKHFLNAKRRITVLV